jgi:hypothetical protein
MEDPFKSANSVEDHVLAEFHCTSQ